MVIIVEIIMYGQTGTGKSYTMGSSMAVELEDAGIIPWFLKDVFETTDHEQNIEYMVYVSFVEFGKE